MRRHAPPEERRAQILEAALACFSARGYHATTMDDLVRASGLSKGSLYWHFASKEDVFLGVFDYIGARILGRFDEAAVAGDGDVMGLLKSEIDAFLDGFGSERKLLLAWAEFLSHPRARERMAGLYRRSREKLAGLIALGIERGELRAGLDPGLAAGVLTGAADALVLQGVVDPDFDVRAHMGELWDILSIGTSAPDGGPRARP